MDDLYKDYSGDYWFVGMEEGGGNDLDQVSKRINVWQDLGCPELVDIYDFHIKINYPEYFTNPVKLQRTWMQQARIILASKGKPTTSSDVKTYQRDIIGRKTSETCLLELFPLPSPSTKTWNYDQWSRLTILKNREVYRNYCFSWRCEHIQSKIKLHQPKLVVFCGSIYSDYWKNIAGGDVTFRYKGDFLAAKSGITQLLIVKHPATMGIKNVYFESIGSFVLSS